MKKEILILVLLSMISYGISTYSAQTYITLAELDTARTQCTQGTASPMPFTSYFHAGTVSNADSGLTQTAGTTTGATYLTATTATGSETNTSFGGTDNTHDNSLFYKAIISDDSTTTTKKFTNGPFVIYDIDISSASCSAGAPVSGSIAFSIKFCCSDEEASTFYSTVTLTNAFYVDYNGSVAGTDGALAVTGSTDTHALSELILGYQTNCS